MLEIRVLGPLTLASESEALPLPSRRQTQFLLIYLVLKRDLSIRIDQAISDLWPEADAVKGRKLLSSHLYFLRTALPSLGENDEAWFLRDRDSIRWNRHARVSLDIDEFEHTVRRARLFADGENSDAEIQALESALALVAGEIAQPFEAEWLGPFRERQKTVELRVLDRLGEVLLESRELPRAQEVSEQLLSVRPWHEPAARRLMQIHAASQRSDLVEDVLRSLRESLLLNFDSGPSAETLKLVESIQAGKSGKTAGMNKDPIRRRANEERRTPLHRVPRPVSSFVGRSHELAAVQDLRSISRLVTLTGPGGSGKTRLALVSVSDSKETMSNSVRWIELTSVSDRSAVADAVLRQLGGRAQGSRSPLDSIVEMLGELERTLVFDNCEHVLEDASIVIKTLLGSCPNVHILATSREPLGLPGEATFAVLPLPIPKGGSLTPIEEIVRADSVQLFIDRVREEWGDYQPTTGALRAIARVCGQVEGLPLAIELAAARINVMSEAEIADRLDETFAILRSSGRYHVKRHQVLESTIDWSFELLTPDEESVFLQACIFDDSFTFDAALAVLEVGTQGSTIDATADALVRLVDRSLIEQLTQTPTGRRFRLLAMVREFGRSRLLAANHFERTATRHASYFESLAERFGQEIRTGDEELALETLEREVRNLDSTLSYLGSKDDMNRTATMAASLTRFWFKHGHAQRVRPSIEIMLREHSSSLSQAALERLREGCGVLAYGLGDYEAAQQHWRSALDTDKKSIPSVERAYLLNNLGIVAMIRGDFAAARKAAAESVRTQEALGDQYGVAAGLGFQTTLSYRRGDFISADAFASQGLSVCATDEVARRFQEHLMRERSDALIRLGQHRTARKLLDNAIELLQDGKEGKLLAGCINGSGVLHLQMGDIDAARDCFREALKLWNDVGSQSEAAMAITNLGDLELRSGSLSAARAYLQRATEMKLGVSDAWSSIYTRLHNAELAFRSDAAEAASEEAASCLLAARELPARSLESWALRILGGLDLDTELFEGAESHFSESLRIAHECGEKRAIAIALEGLGAALIGLGRSDDGERLLESASAVRAHFGIPRTTVERNDLEKWVENQALRDSLAREADAGSEALEEADLEQAIATLVAELVVL